MKVNFRDICGNYYNLEIPDNSSVADACKFLSQKIGIQDNQLFFVSANDNFNFYQNDESMVNVLKENPEFVIFIRPLTKPSNQNQIKEPSNATSDSNESQKQPNDDIIGKNEFDFTKSLKMPTNCCYNALYGIKYWYYEDIYDDYSLVVNEVPHDVQAKIDQLAELGYHIEDIKEALRTTNYDVSLAIHFLMLHHANYDDNDYDSDDHYIYDSDNENEASESEYNNDNNNDNENRPKPDENVEENKDFIEKVDDKKDFNEKVYDKKDFNKKVDDKKDFNEKVDDKKNFNEKVEDKKVSNNVPVNKENENSDIKSGKNDDKKNLGENVVSYKTS